MKNSLFNLVLLSIFLVPLASVFPVRGGDVWYASYLYLFLASFFGISLFLWRFNKYISIFTMVVLFCSVFNVNLWFDQIYQVGRQCLLGNIGIRESISAILNPGVQVLSMAILVQTYLSFLAIYAISKFSRKQRNKILHCVFFLVLIQGGWVVLQYFNLDPIFNHSVNQSIDDTVGFSGSHNQIGIFFAVTSPLIVYFPVLLPLTIFGIWCSTTTTAWVAFLVSSMVTLFFKKERALCFVLMIIMAVLSTNVFMTRFEDFSKDVYIERFELYKHTVKAVVSGKINVKSGNVTQVVTSNPLFGYGPGNFIKLSPKSQTFINKGKPVTEGQSTHVYSHVHNDYLEVFFWCGFIGIFALFGVMFDFFRKFILAKKTKILIISFCCVLAHMICALGVFSVHTAVSGMLLILFLGIFYGEVRDQEVLDG